MNLIRVIPHLEIDTSMDPTILDFLAEQGVSQHLTDSVRIGYLLRKMDLAVSEVCSSGGGRIRLDQSAEDLVNHFLFGVHPGEPLDFRMGSYTRQALMILEFLKLQPFTVALVSLNDLGFDSSRSVLDVKLPEIASRASEFGLGYCPNAFPIAFRLSQISIAPGAHITIASEGIAESRHSLDAKVFSLHGYANETQLSKDHALSTDCYLGEIQDNGGEMWFSGAKLGLPDQSRFVFIFGVSESEVGELAGSSISGEKLTKGDLRRSLLDQSASELVLGKVQTLFHTCDAVV